MPGRRMSLAIVAARLGMVTQSYSTIGSTRSSRAAPNRGQMKAKAVVLLDMHVAMLMVGWEGS